MHELILFAAGLIVGVMNAVAGGGMLIGFPIMAALGVPLIVANATTSLIVLPGAIASSIANRRYLKQIPRSYMVMAIPATIGAVIGTGLLVRTSADSFGHIIPGLILFAVLLFAMQPFLHEYARRHIHGPKRRREQIRPVYVMSLAVLPMAIYAGYFGAGFGFIMLAFLGFTGLHDHLHRMNSLKNAVAICISTVALLSLLHTGLIDWHSGLVMGVGSLIGGYGTSIWLRRVDSRTIRIIVVLIGIAAAVYLALHKY